MTETTDQGATPPVVDLHISRLYILGEKAGGAQQAERRKDSPLGSGDDARHPSAGRQTERKQQQPVAPCWRQSSAEDMLSHRRSCIMGCLVDIVQMESERR